MSNLKLVIRCFRQFTLIITGISPQHKHTPLPHTYMYILYIPGMAWTLTTGQWSRIYHWSKSSRSQRLRPPPTPHESAARPPTYNVRPNNVACTWYHIIVHTCKLSISTNKFSNLRLISKFVKFIISIKLYLLVIGT